MRELFADSGYWIALLHPKDQLHEQANALAARLVGVPVVTTQMALVEALNHLAGRGERLREVGAQMVQGLTGNPNVEISPQTAAQFSAALKRYTARADQTWSLTDCASFAVMEQRGITDALAHDRDFEQAGFAALLRQDEA